MPHPVKDLLEISEDMVEILMMMMQVFLAEYLEIEYLLCDAPSRSETSLLFCNEPLSLWLEFNMIFNMILADQADGSMCHPDTKYENEKW